MSGSARPSESTARALAREHREALQARTRRIRRTVAALATTMFAVAFLVIYVQLASGHDPALAAAARRSTATSSTDGKSSTGGAASTEVEASSATESSTSAESSSASGAAGSGSAGSASTEEPSTGVSAVTTSQS